MTLDGLQPDADAANKSFLTSTGSTTGAGAAAVRPRCCLFELTACGTGYDTESSAAADGALTRCLIATLAEALGAEPRYGEEGGDRTVCARRGRLRWEELLRGVCLMLSPLHTHRVDPADRSAGVGGAAAVPRLRTTESLCSESVFCAPRAGRGECARMRIRQSAVFYW